MKRKIIATCLTALFSGLSFSAQITFFDIEGEWRVAGYTSGKDYYEQESRIITDYYDNEIAEASKNKSLEGEDLKQLKINAKNHSLDTVRRDSIYIDATLQNLKAGLDLEEAKIQGMDYANKKTPPIWTDNTGYNSGNTSNATAFKQFNSLDCSFDDINNYASQSFQQETSAMQGLPTPQKIKTAATKVAAKKEEMGMTSSGSGSSDEGACSALAGNLAKMEMPEMPDLGGLEDLLGLLGSIFGDAAGAAQGMIDKAKDTMSDGMASAEEYAQQMSDNIEAELMKTVCEKTNMDTLTESGIEALEDEYKSVTKGTGFEGTSLDKLGSERGQNSFTFQLIKNQAENADNNLIKAVDFTRDDQAEYQEKVYDKESKDAVDKTIEDLLDELDEAIFG